MSTCLARIVKESFEVKCESFIELVNESAELLSSEEGKTGNLYIMNRLVKIEPKGEALVVGDLHGDLESLIDILKECDFVSRLENNSDSLAVFLGDYGDRGAHSVQVYYTLLSLKLLFPRQIVLLRGNHEGPADLMAEPHDFPDQLRLAFGERWVDAYASVRRLFECLYNAALVDRQYLFIHGGLPVSIGGIEDLADAHTLHPRQSYLEEMLWSDPNDVVKEDCASPRGAGRLFGEAVTSRALGRLGSKVFVRGHEPCQEGFKIDHGGKVLTLFSRKGSPYFNKHGAYLLLPLSQKVENAWELLSCLRRF